MREDGTISPLWERRMVAVPFPAALPLGWTVETGPVYAKRASVNEAIVYETANLFRAWYKENLWTALRTYDGGFTWRAKRDSTQLSMHAYGAALDFNARTNRLGTKGDMDPRLVDIARAQGWTWGGEWKRPDPMHFQYGLGY
jgi:hypothetical protein